MMRVRLADREIAGRFDTIDETGRLVLVTADGERSSVAAGDVLALQPQPSAPAPDGRG
jgi:biotin-(acetyl-CoA carboxylase) ligase